MIISYAQNFEDVMLWRALKNIPTGFYVDVGANDPNIDSVTKLFYENGWTGINIEPLDLHHAALERERPKDLNLRLAVGSKEGEINIWTCDVRGWATIEQSVVDEHVANGTQGHYEKVPLTTLKAVCRQYITHDIHFLKIDVEGAEAAVISGMDFQRFRPWIIIIEATQPHSTMEVHQSWEPILLSHGYFFIYADGLNRFYLSNEHSELSNYFKYPPNFFDDFVKAPHIEDNLWAETIVARARHWEESSLDADKKIIALEKLAEHFEQQAKHFEQALGHLEKRAVTSDLHAAEARRQSEVAQAFAEQCKSMVEAATVAVADAELRVGLVFESFSWRITAPLRATVDLLIRVRKVRLKKFLLESVQFLFRFIKRHELLRRSFIYIIKKIPLLESYLKKIVFKSNNLKLEVNKNHAPQSIIYVSPYTYRIYKNLKKISIN